jgi:hypothetical protein
MKKYSISLDIREMQNKTMLNIISPQSEWLLYKNRNKITSARVVEEKEISDTADGNVN